MPTMKKGSAYAFTCLFALKGIVEEAAIDDRNQGVSFDVGRKLKVAVRFTNMPFFLELGGSFTII